MISIQTFLVQEIVEDLEAAPGQFREIAATRALRDGWLRQISLHCRWKVIMIKNAGKNDFTNAALGNLQHRINGKGIIPVVDNGSFQYVALEQIHISS
jgi:hypothetical protein